MAASPAAAPAVQIRLPAGWTFAALIAGLALGWALAGSAAGEGAGAIAGPVGALWLRGLQMTIVPLVAALLVTGIARMVATASAGPMARRTLLTFFAVLAAGTALAAVAMPVLLAAFPIPGQASASLAAQGGSAQPVPGLGAFLESLVSSNVIAAAAETAMLPLIVFFAAFAVAITRLEETRRDMLLQLFGALGDAMLTIIGWVLWLAPVGVFALGIGVGLDSGGGAFAALAHYILLVSGMGFAVLVAAYALGAWQHGPARFARAVLPAQTVAISTQSSLASLPAMLQSCRLLGVRETTADFVLPLAVAIFRATSPAMNLGVAIYVAHLAGVELTPAAIAAGAAVALVTTIGSVSLPGTISFVASIGPIAIAMGVPIEPLAILVAVEMVPDIMRTLGNVTMDVAVTARIDRANRASG
ncbi:MAG TPA: cation:dicarboxylase symporter family transporter [Croceibacterium sp.]|nr:cation:dicarboxylase symporter family transporter [Croceibacterium sp.]